LLEYIFFDERPWRHFIDFIKELGLEPETSRGDEGWLVALPEEIEDALNERIEAFYDEMLDYNESLVAEREGVAHRHLAGLSVSLSDGRTVLAPVDPGLMQRVLSVVTPQELGELVDAVVAAVENPDERSLCQR
jgi:hypothetical protein